MITAGRARVLLAAPVLALSVLVTWPQVAHASCTAPTGPKVPKSVQAGDTIRVSGTASFFCNDIGGTPGHPAPTPGPAPKSLSVTLVHTTSNGENESGVVIGSVPVTQSSADKTYGSFRGDVRVPAATTPGTYYVLVDGAGPSLRMKVLPAVVAAPTLPFTGTPNVAPQTAVGVLSLLVGLLFCSAGRRVRQ